jgi:hypothetical protein
VGQRATLRAFERQAAMLTVDTISRLRIRAAQAEGVGQRATASDLRIAADELSRLDAELAAIRLAPRPLAPDRRRYLAG